MKGYCNQCGKCCEAIRLGVSPDEFTRGKNEAEHTNFGFAYRHWHNISDDDAFRINPLLRLQKEAGLITYDMYYYTCDMYDATTHKCTAHANRPHVCREYPYYGRLKPSEEYTWYSATCGYIDDTVGHGERALMMELADEVDKL